MGKNRTLTYAGMMAYRFLEPACVCSGIFSRLEKSLASEISARV